MSKHSKTNRIRKAQVMAPAPSSLPRTLVETASKVLQSKDPATIIAGISLGALGVAALSIKAIKELSTNKDNGKNR